VIFKKILSVSLLLFASYANAGTDIKNLKDSIFKIAIYAKSGKYVATAFSLEQNGEKYLVTNNHVCHDFNEASRVVLIQTQCMEELPVTKKECQNLDKIKTYYMDYGSDICIMKSERSDSYPALKLGNKRAEPTETVLVSGFVGRSMDLMYVEGKVYGTTTIPHATELKNCLFNPPDVKNVSAGITCTFFTDYPEYTNKKLQVAVNNIGPGFSGSPVLQDGKVIGIVSRYFVPAGGYNNGDVIFFPIEDIKLTISNSKGKFIDVTSTEYRLYLKIVEFDENVKENLSKFEADMKSLVKETFKTNE
jgi:S1-C subfamily serine protease